MKTIEAGTTINATMYDRRKRATEFEFVVLNNLQCTVPLRPVSTANHGWKMHDRQMKACFDVRGDWSKAGHVAIQIANVKVWVEPLDGGGALKAFRTKSQKFHRVRAECPVCGDEVSAGRLHQHISKPACHQSKQERLDRLAKRLVAEIVEEDRMSDADAEKIAAHERSSDETAFNNDGPL